MMPRPATLSSGEKNNNRATGVLPKNKPMTDDGFDRMKYPEQGRTSVIRGKRREKQLHPS